MPARRSSSKSPVPVRRTQSPKSRGTRSKKTVPVTSTPPVEASVVRSIVDRMIDLFRLLPVEQRLVRWLETHPGPTEVGQVASELGVETSELCALLSPAGVLRGRALVEVSGEADLAFPAPQDTLQLARGLLLPATWGDAASSLPIALPGLWYLAAPAPGTSWAHELVGEKSPAAIGDLVKDHFVAQVPILGFVGQVKAEQDVGLAQALRSRLQRPVAVLDASALQGVSVTQLWRALRALRRDCDVRGCILLVMDAQKLGGSWRAVAHPRAPGQTAPILLTSPDALPTLGRPAEIWPACTPFAIVQSVLRNPAAPLLPSAAATTASGQAGLAASAVEDEDGTTVAKRDEARRQAAIDAARAMGRPIPRELTDGARATPAASPVTTGSQAPVAMQASAGSPSQAAAARPAAPPSVPAVAPAGASAGPRAVNPRLAAALAAAGLPPPGSTRYQEPGHVPPANSAVAAPPAPAQAAAPAQAPAQATPTGTDGAMAASTAPTVAAQSEAPAVAGAEDFSEDPPALPLEAEAPLEEVIKVARTTSNRTQRIELMKRLFGAKHPGVIHLFRSNLATPSALVNAVAADGMSSVFGPSWNRTRGIAPPLQPPRTDDGGRGPGGAF